MRYAYMALLAVLALFVLYVLIMYGDMDELAIIISLGWVVVLSAWARIAQAATHRAERKREHAQLLEALGYTPPEPETEPEPRPWSPHMPPFAETE